MSENDSYDAWSEHPLDSAGIPTPAGPRAHRDEVLDECAVFYPPLRHRSRVKDYHRRLERELRRMTLVVGVLVSVAINYAFIALIGS